MLEHLGLGMLELGLEDAAKICAKHLGEKMQKEVVRLVGQRGGKSATKNNQRGLRFEMKQSG